MMSKKIRKLNRTHPNPVTLGLNMKQVIDRGVFPLISAQYQEFCKIHRCEPIINEDSPDAGLIADVMGKGII
jgi:hypothetical protein